jgi:Na+/phosphate symporter
MDLYILLSLAVCLLGLFMWWARQDTWVGQVGRIMFAAGLLVFMLSFPHKALHF